ncbi:MAG: GntR family transcriptional regulator [Oscillospiraceae bacterium]
MIVQRPGLTGPGAKLPNEPRLCELFGVSRATPREAVRLLWHAPGLAWRSGEEARTFESLDRAKARRDTARSGWKSLRTRLRDPFESWMMIAPQAGPLTPCSGHR